MDRRRRYRQSGTDAGDGTGRNCSAADAADDQSRRDTDHDDGGCTAAHDRGGDDRSADNSHDGNGLDHGVDDHGVDDHSEYDDDRVDVHE